VRAREAFLISHQFRIGRVLPAIEWRLLSIAVRGCDVFRAACERDLEGIDASGRTARTRRTAALRRG